MPKESEPQNRLFGLAVLIAVDYLSVMYVQGRFRNTRRSAHLHDSYAALHCGSSRRIKFRRTGIRADTADATVCLSDAPDDDFCVGDRPAQPVCSIPPALVTVVPHFRLTPPFSRLILLTRRQRASPSSASLSDAQARLRMAEKGYDVSNLEKDKRGNVGRRQVRAGHA